MISGGVPLLSAFYVGDNQGCARAFLKMGEACPDRSESAQFHHAEPDLQHSATDLATYDPLQWLRREQKILASALFIAASITDGIDGYLARKRGQITTMGMLLDPLADKLLIAAAFITLVQFNPSLVPAWIAVVIIGREFLVSGLRSIAASEGFTIEASDLGKFKMVVQIVSVVAVILDHRWKEWPIYSGYFFPSTPSRTSRSGSWWFCHWFRRSTISRLSGQRSTGKS